MTNRIILFKIYKKAVLIVLRQLLVKKQTTVKVSTRFISSKLLIMLRYLWLVLFTTVQICFVFQMRKLKKFTMSTRF